MQAILMQIESLGYDVSIHRVNGKIELHTVQLVYPCAQHIARVIDGHGELESYRCACELAGRGHRPAGRVKRRLLNLLTTVSLGLSVAVGVVWVIGHPIHLLGGLGNCAAAAGMRRQRGRSIIRDTASSTESEWPVWPRWWRRPELKC